MKVKVAHSCPTLCDPVYYTVHRNLISQASAQQGWPSEGWPWSRADVERKNPLPAWPSLCSQPLRPARVSAPGRNQSTPRRPAEQPPAGWSHCGWAGARRVEVTFILPTVTFCYWNGSRLQNPHPHFSARASRQLRP